MSQPKRWWIGLLPLGLIWLVANWIETPRIEQDLLARAKSIVAASSKDLIKADVSVAGRDIAIRGESVQGDVARATADSAQNIHGTRLVHADVASAARQSPYVLTAERDGAAVTIAGFAPAAATKERMLAAAGSAFGAAPVGEQIKLAAGAPPQFEASVAHGLQQLAKLSKGKFSLTDLSYSLEGVAQDSRAFAALSGLAGELPAGVKAGRIAIVAPAVAAYSFVASKNAEGVTLNGHVPDVATRARLLALAGIAYRGAKIDDRLAFASGAPQGFEALAAHGLRLAGGLAGSVFALNGSTYNLSGATPDAPGFEGVLSALKALPAGASAGKIEILPPEVRPYTWSVRRLADGTILFEGAAPDAATLDALLAQAAKLYPGAKIENRMQIARTAPAGFAAGAALALGNVGKLSGGTISMIDGLVSLSGEAASQAAADALGAAFAALPGGLRLGTNALKAAIPELKPYTWSVRRLDDGTIVIDGAAPDAATRDALLAQAAKLYPGAKIENRMQIARTAPAGFAAAATMALENVGKMKGGVFSFSDSALTIGGEAVDKAAADAIASALAGLGNAFRVAANTISVEPPPPAPAPVQVPVQVPVQAPAPVPVTEPPKPVAEAVQPVAAALPAAPRAISCERKGNAPLASAMIYFREGSHVLDGDQVGSLKDILAALKTCGRASVNLIGHTNSHGDRERNIQLSTLRTFAASRWLQENGIPKRRIETLGYGEDRLMQPETTPDAVAKNRRVEINVR